MRGLFSWKRRRAARRAADAALIEFHARNAAQARAEQAAATREALRAMFGGGLD